jgi:hypothetical protein
MKPETLARRARERAAALQAGAISLRDRLQTQAQQYGPDSIYAELLAEHLARHPEL